MRKIYKSAKIEKSPDFIREDDDNFYVSGYASTYGNEDLAGHIIEKGAFTESLKKLSPKILFNHDIGRPLGVTEGTREDNVGLFLSCKMPKSDPFISDTIMPQVKIGSIDSFSVGFFLGQHDWNKGKLIIKSGELFETSLVTLPANREAKITSFKSMEDVECLADIEWILKDYGFSSKEAKTIISKITTFKSADFKKRDAVEINKFSDELLSLCEKLTNFNFNK